MTLTSATGPGATEWTGPPEKAVGGGKFAPVDDAAAASCITGIIGSGLRDGYASLSETIAESSMETYAVD